MKKKAYICIIESLCWTGEINNIVNNYTLIKNRFTKDQSVSPLYDK